MYRVFSLVSTNKVRRGLSLIISSTALQTCQYTVFNDRTSTPFYLPLCLHLKSQVVVTLQFRISYKPFISDGQNKGNDSLCCLLSGWQRVGTFLQQMWMKYVDGTDLQVTSCNPLVSYKHLYVNLIFYIHMTVHRNKLLCNEPNRRTRFQIYSCKKTLHVSGGSSTHHHELATVHSALAHVIQQACRIRMEHPDPARLLSSNLYNMCQCRMYSN